MIEWRGDAEGSAENKDPIGFNKKAKAEHARTGVRLWYAGGSKASLHEKSNLIRSANRRRKGVCKSFQ